MADVQSLVQSREFLARSPEERDRVLKIFESASSEEQTQILSQLTRATPAERAADIAPALQWLPGLEFMHVLPESAQRTVAGYLPGLTAATIQTGAQVGGAALGAATGPFAAVAIPTFVAPGFADARKLTIAQGV